MKLKTIGTGLGRTGTMSLKFALEYLDESPCFHMIELMKKTERLSILKNIRKNSNTDWNAFFEGYTSAVDYPVCLFYKELIEINPDLKVIYTERNFDSWYTSVYETIYRGKPKGFLDILKMIKNMILSSDFRKVAPVFMYSDKLIWEGQFQSRFEDKAFVETIYNQHLETVKAVVKPENLLIYNIKDGWKPLCEFLGRPIPDIPFPRTNQRDEFNRKMDKLLVEGVFEE